MAGSRYWDKSKTALVMITRDGLLPWKRTLDVVRRASDLGLEVCVGIDSRTTDETFVLVRPYARVTRLQNDQPYCDHFLNTIIDNTEKPWIFIVSDDEWPSEELWDFAVNAHKRPPFIYRPHILSLLPNERDRHYLPLETRQPRVFPRDSIRWATHGIDVLPQMNLREADIDPILWHYNLWAPREFREAKVAAHEAAWNSNYDSHPWPYPGRRSYLFEDHMEEVARTSLSPEPVAQPQSE